MRILISIKLYNMYNMMVNFDLCDKMLLESLSV